MCQLIFCSVSVKFKPISIKIIRHVPEETLFNKIMEKVHTSTKICASTTLGNLKWQTEPSTQYIHYILMNHWRSTKTTVSYCLKNCRMCRMSHHFYITCLKCLPPARTKHVDAGATSENCTFNKQCDSDCSLVLDALCQFVNIWDLGSARGGHFEHVVYRWCNLVHVWQISRGWLLVVAVAIQWFIKMYM